MDKRKSLLWALAAVVFCVCFWVTPDVRVSAAGYLVYDEGDYLTDEEETYLNEYASGIAGVYEIDVGMVITDDSWGMSAEEYAIDVYETYLDADDGILLAVCMDLREYYILTAGSVNATFTDTEYLQIEEDLSHYLGDEAYAMAFDDWLTDVDALLESRGFPLTEAEYEAVYDDLDEPQSVSSSNGWSTAGEMFLWELLFGCVVASIFVAVMWSQCKTGMAPTHAAQHMVQNSLKLEVRDDVFLHSVTRKTPKPKSRSGSGGGSRGRSYGGKGGRF